MTTKLYVGNLSFNTTENDITDLFSNVGTVSRVELINDKMTGRSRGFGFVTMADAAGAEAATSKYDNAEFQGRNLTVNEAKEREDRPSNGGGNRSGGDRDRNGGGDRRPARRY